MPQMTMAYAAADKAAPPTEILQLTAKSVASRLPRVASPYIVIATPLSRKSHTV